MTNWVIEFGNNGDTIQEIVQCDVVGVAQDGSLLCFEAPMGSQSPLAIKGFAPGCWTKFYRSTLRSN